jgi:excisionase family DNA binding protein
MSAPVVLVEASVLDNLLSEVRALRASVEAAERPAQWLTAKDAAALLSMSEPALRRSAQRGEIPSTKLPSGRVRFDRAELERWARSAS